MADVHQYALDYNEGLAVAHERKVVGNIKNNIVAVKTEYSKHDAKKSSKVT